MLMNQQIGLRWLEEGGSRNMMLRVWILFILDLGHQVVKNKMTDGSVDEELFNVYLKLWCQF